MVAFGKWKLYSRHERPDLANGLQSRGHSAHFQSLQEHRADWSFLQRLRHLLAHAGSFDIHRADDTELLNFAAHELASGKIFLVQDDARMTLDGLWKAVKATRPAKTFLAQLSRMGVSPPELEWGSPAKGHKGEYTADNKIVLNQDMKDSLSDCQWKQVIAMELGNAAHSDAFNDIYDKAEKGHLSQSDFADKIVAVELESRNAVSEAFKSQEICREKEDGYKPIFEGTINLAAYKADPRGLEDWSHYAEEWTKEYASAYAKRHPMNKK